MNIQSIPSKLFALTIFFVISANSALAEDIEIYTSSSSTPSAAKPNLTFIIDTSGSMASTVILNKPSYDPTVTYSGSCDATKIFYSKNGKPPTCGTNRWIDVSANTCADSFSSLSATGSGFYVGKFARYRVKSNKEDRWKKLSSKKHSQLIECVADLGTHGAAVGDGNPYPSDQNDSGPWRSDATNSINWNNIGATYTFYSANYINWRNSPASSTSKTRLDVVKEVFSDLVDSTSNINISVMRFDADGSGGYFVMPMQELVDSNRAAYKTAVNSLTAGGNTPLAESLYESYLFYRGDTVDYGDSSSPGTNTANVFTGSQYDSPVSFQCQKNFVVLLTDGAPTYDTEADVNIENLSGFSAVTGASSCSGNCLDELAEYMYTKDCSNLYNDKQNVITYTIGFTSNQALLQNAATKGGGKYFTADDTSGLTDAFTSILTEILAINTTFIAPAVSVNAFNRFTHREELYYALFRPNDRPKWDGNLKRYRLYGTPPIIVDANLDPAIDPNTGFFKSTTTSFWTPVADAPDGGEVKDGGAASMLTLTNRKMYTYTGSTAASNEDLTATANVLHESNADITGTMLGDNTMSASRRTLLLQWLRGVDVFDDDSDSDSLDTRRAMGDPLHTKPVLITYGGTALLPDITLYAATNEGHLYAVNSTTGQEIFSFFPQELLENVATLVDDTGSASHPYGLDGPLTTWVNDVNDNGVILDNGGILESGEFAYVYQGMRRGGKNYYAINVTDRALPILSWVIKGGSGVFSELAQTWSALTRMKIRLNGTVRSVLVFGGGYDVNQDGNALPSADSEGRAIYIVDALTGVKLWQAGPALSANGVDPDLLLTDMTSSIPATVRPIDVDADGVTDQMYVGDMQGRIWRFDFNQTNTGAATLATGGIIAELGAQTVGSPTAPENRRFYYSTDVSQSRDLTHLNIAIGSGYRSHPLETAVKDAFFVLRDPNIYGPKLDGLGNPVYDVTKIADLYDATDNAIGQGSASTIAVAQTALAGSKGLYIKMKEVSGTYIGEKVLSQSITYSSRVMFTTYTPTVSGSGACSPSQGAANAYLINIEDGTPVYDFNKSGGSFTIDDRKLNLVRGGIPPEPTLIFHQNGPVILIGTEKAPDPEFLLKPTKTYWKVDSD